MKTYKFATCLIKQNEKVLLIQEQGVDFRGKWSVPGGRLEQNEDFFSACVREASEEAGASVNPISIFHSITQEFKEEEIIKVKKYIWCDLKEINYTDNCESLSMKWFGIDEIPDILLKHPDEIEIFEDFLKNK